MNADQPAFVRSYSGPPDERCFTELERLAARPDTRAGSVPFEASPSRDRSDRSWPAPLGEAGQQRRRGGA